MERKNTDQLQQELMTGNDLDRVLADNDSSFRGYALQERLQALFQRREISKTALAFGQMNEPPGSRMRVAATGLTMAEYFRQSGISEVYLHQVFSGRRTPSRNRLLCLCFGLGASVDEAQELLRHARLAPLYSRDRRDAIVIFGLSHNMTLGEINDKLYAEDADTLC